MTELDSWMELIRKWATDLARRRRRWDMLEDIESTAFAYSVEHGLVGQAPTPELETYVARALALTDNFKLARDSDLTAAVNERAKDRADLVSYLEEFVMDPKGEDDLASVLDGEPREEGRDQAEILSEIEEASAELSIEDDQVLSLQHLWGYSIRETAQYMGWSTTKVSMLRKQSRIRLRAKRELQELKARMKTDPAFTQLEVSWIRL